MNPRRMVVEERALALADALQADGHGYLAGCLREVVPDDFGLCDEHVPLLRDALAAVVRGVSDWADDAAHVIAALDDLPAHIGQRGRVMVGRASNGDYNAHWVEDDWLEEA